MEKQHLSLHEKEKKALEDLLSKGFLPVKVFKRATAHLELNRGKSFGAVAEMVGVCYQRVSSWCTGYKEEGFSMLWDAARSGRPVVKLMVAKEPKSPPCLLYSPEGMVAGGDVCGQRKSWNWATVSISRTTMQTGF